MWSTVVSWTPGTKLNHKKISRVYVIIYNMDKMSIGEKIKFIRKKSGVSQFELETRIGASAGSISKMEKGETNPTKETLIKIVQALSIKPKDAAMLFDINVAPEMARLVSLSKELTSDLDLKSIMQKAVDILSSELDYIIITIFLVKRDELYSQAFTKTWFYDAINKILPMPVDLIHVSLTNHKDNIVVRSVNEQKILYTENLYDIGRHAVSEFVSKTASKIYNFKCALVMPLINPQGKPIGAIFFGKNKLESFDNEMPVLNAFVEYLTTIIINAQKFENLQNELKKLKN